MNFKADVDKAVAAAKQAFARGSPWRAMDASARGVFINKVIDSIRALNLIIYEELFNPYLWNLLRGILALFIAK